MKKIVSVLLAVVLAFSALAISVAAEGGEYQTYYVNFDAADFIQIVPTKGYDQYVTPGDDFKFYIEVSQNYSDTFVIVEINSIVTEPDSHGIYTISDVQSDCEVRAYFALEEEQSNLFASLIVFVHQILEWFVNIFNSIFSMGA